MSSGLQVPGISFASIHEAFFMSDYPILPLNEQLVLITGAARGLGAHLARAFAREGAQVIINYYQSQEAAQQLAQTLGNQALALKADVRDEQAVQTLVEKAQAHFNRPVKIGRASCRERVERRGG